MHSQIWFALPLVAVVSVVYAASRHEEMKPILVHALRFGVSVTGFLAILFAVLAFLSWWV